MLELMTSSAASASLLIVKILSKCIPLQESWNSFVILSDKLMFLICAQIHKWETAESKHMI